MRICEIEIFPVRQFVYLKILTDDGLSGLGEASLNGRSLAVVEALNHVRDALVGQDATRIEHLWQKIFRGTFWRGGPVLQSALAGLDIALWDLAGKSLGVPTYRLLGGAARTKALAYCHAGGKNPEEIAADAKRLAEQGWKAVRIAPLSTMPDGFDPVAASGEAVRSFAAVREAVGDDVEIIIDVHTRLSPPRAIELCNALAEYRPFFVEDPIRPENSGSYATLRAHTSVPIATGEQLHSKWEYRELIERELVDYLRVDVCHTGGLTEGRKIAAMGEVHHQDLALHYTGSPVSTASMLHLNLSVPNCAVQEHNPFAPWMNEVIRHDLKTEGGYLLLPEKPGLGVEIDERAAAAYPYETGVHKHWLKPDGSVQDW
jgi:galactonate dehydratase